MTEPEASTTESSSTVPPDESTTSTSTDSSTAAGTTEATVRDIGVPDFDLPSPLGCLGKIDFLFAISSEPTMQPVQERLVASFPGFMGAVQEQLAEFDVHILVANTDENWAIGDCAVCTGGCDPEAQPPYCGADFTACDETVGAGVTFPSGPFASNRRCELDGGRRYITSGQQDLEGAFARMAQVGTYGAGITAEAMVAALQPVIVDPDDDTVCNSGFLRNDALLVVTIIQDMYDEYSLGSVDAWIEQLRAAKGGDDHAFALLVLTTDVDVGYGQLCHPNEFNGTKNRLRVLAEGVEHGFIDSICMESYDEFFTSHVTELAELCDAFVPPG